MSEQEKPKKTWIFYPLLFAIFPVLSLYSANLALVSYSFLLRPLLVSLLATAAIWAILTLVLRSMPRAAVATSVIFASVLLFSKSQILFAAIDFPPVWRMPAWAIVSVLVCVVAAWKWRWHSLLNVLSSALILVTVGQIALGLQRAAAQRSQVATATAQGSTVTVDKPDIIYIILDGYGRSDALKRALNFSNKSFVDGLEQRGFYVAKDARANYCQTELSVASSLNMDSIQTLAPNAQDRAVLSKLTSQSRVTEYLHNLGYTFASITSNFPPLQFDTADVNLNASPGMTLIESALIQMTPLNIGFVGRSIFDQHRQWTLGEFEALERLGGKTVNPRFVIMHVLAPHPPFVFNADGSKRPSQPPYGFWDGSDYVERVGSREDYQAGYSAQAEFIGKRLLTAIDAILARRKDKPIIIVQGDHGSKMRLDQLELDRTDVNECFPNLNAFLVPDSVRSKLYPGITPINSFRTLFNGLFGENFSMLPDRSWYSSYATPFKFEDVTTQIAGPDKMPTLPLPTFKPRFGT